MSDTASKEPVAVWPERPSFLTLMLGQLLPKLECGGLTVILPHGQRLHVNGVAAGPSGIVMLHRWRVLLRLLQGGDIGFAEAYMDGDWSSPDLTSLIEVAARNQASIPVANGGCVLARLVNRLRHLLHANTLTGSRRNIVQHYDLGNEFYDHWLDVGMNYSSALFHSSDMGLEAAQAAKQNRVLELLDLRPGQSALEIGFGWGGMAERLVRASGRLTGLTLSPAQLSYARDRLTRLGLAADLRLQDYRHVHGHFNRIVSIEMLEAVGEAWWPVYFGRLHDLLAEDGRIVLQTITIADDRFEAYRRGVDFIQRYIFPGGILPAHHVLRREIASAGLEVVSAETFGDSYARTLEIWRERFNAAWPALANGRFTPRFKRMWDYYLAYSAAGFRAGAIDVGLWCLRHQR